MRLLTLPTESTLMSDPGYKATSPILILSLNALMSALLEVCKVDSDNAFSFSSARSICAKIFFAQV